MWLKRAAFDATGKETAPPVNLTTPYLGMAYLALHPSGGSALFATEDAASANVNTWIVDFASGNATMILHDLANLTAPCRNSTPACNQASTFHATWSDDGKHIVFAYRPWDSYGNAIGSQVRHRVR